MKEDGKRTERPRGKVARIFAWVLLCGPVWAAILGWCLRNAAANQLAAGGTSNELIAHYMAIALFATLVGGACFVAGVVLLVLSRRKCRAEESPAEGRKKGTDP